MNRHRQHLQTEVDASFLYRTLGEHADEPALAEIYFGMAKIEDSHARKMLEKYLSQGITATLPKPSVRARIQVKLARLFGDQPSLVLIKAGVWIRNQRQDYCSFNASPGYAGKPL
ncbi:MAG: hypothetical protein IH596_05250 [Bacteroidales bacterium]|nr:hypothetical protein [Bacteroidales bacterium]